MMKEDKVHYGVVVWFSVRRGYGFIAPSTSEDNGIKPDIFVHFSDINSDGFRGPEYSIPKPANAFRIVMLGDSETFSFMLSQNDSLAAQLENLLNQNNMFCLFHNLKSYKQDIHMGCNTIQMFLLNF